MKKFSWPLFAAKMHMIGDTSEEWVEGVHGTKETCSKMEQ